MKLGMNAKLYRQTTGTRAAWPGSGAAPNLSEITNVKNLTTNITVGEADVTTRANSGWKAKEPTLKDPVVEWEMVYDPADADVAAILAAFGPPGTTIALAVLDGVKSTAYSAGPPVVTATRGLWADFAITKIDRDEGLENAVILKITAKPGYSAVPPARITVG